MQQINLYNEILKQQQKESGILLALKALATLFLVCLSFSIFTLWDTNSTEQELEKAQLALNQQQQKVNQLLAKKASNGPDNALLGELDQWQKSVNEAAETLQLLAGKETILAQGFSFYLKALAFQSNPDIWLTAIHIDIQKGAMKLEGSTFKPQQIPQTLQQLQSQAVLKGITFDKLEMQQSAKFDGQIDFILSNIEQSEDANSHPQ